MRFSENVGTWGSWVTYATTYSYNLTSSGDGVKYVDVQFQDNAGLNSTAWTIYDSIILDTTPPTGSITINAGANYTTTTSVTLYLTYSDATSGVYKVRYSNDGVWDTEPWESPAGTKAWTLTAGDGTKTVYYQIKDNAGLDSSTYSDTIILQTVSAAYLVVRGFDNGIYYRAYSGGIWGDWNVLPGATCDSPAAAVCNNELHVVVRGSDGSTLWHGYTDLATSTFTGWTLLTGSTPSTPTLTT
jgi:hypothetical protein